jgi:hypothetical protein
VNATKKTGRPKRVKGPLVRVPFLLSQEEDTAFRQASEEKFPGASRGYILRCLIGAFCKETGVKWPGLDKEKP